MSQSRRKIAVFSLILILTLVLASTSVMAFQWCQIFGTCQKTTVVPSTATTSANSAISACQTNLNFYKQQTDSLNSQLKKANSDLTYYKNNAVYWKGQADMVTTAWEKDRQSATSKYNLQDLCGDYVYPRCPSNFIRLTFSSNTGSMHPTFDEQDDDVKAFIPPSNYNFKICDIITYDSPIPISGYYRITHRIVGKNNDRFIVKGDSTSKIDPSYPSKADVRYIVCK